MKRNEDLEKTQFEQFLKESGVTDSREINRLWLEHNRGLRKRPEREKVLILAHDRQDKPEKHEKHQ